ncbi:MAG: transcriptional regulator [Citrobacter freundii]|nr:MAG: transcriptional regulator [Citrobacter freundii]
MNLRNHEDVAHMSIGENLSKIREKAGLTQVQVAKMAEIPLPTYKKYESGSQSPPGDRIRTLAIALRTSADEIVMEPSERDVSQDLKAIFMRYDKLPDEMKAIARFTLRGLLTQMESDLLEGNWFEKTGLPSRAKDPDSA